MRPRWCMYCTTMGHYLGDMKFRRRCGVTVVTPGGQRGYSSNRPLTAMSDSRTGQAHLREDSMTTYTSRPNLYRSLIVVRVLITTLALAAAPTAALAVTTCTTDVDCSGGLVCTAGQCEIPAGDPDNDGLFDQQDPCPLQPRNLCFGPVATDAVSGNELRLNANAVSGSCQGTRVDCNGDTWLADFAYSQAANGAECNLSNGCPISGITEIFGCSDLATEDLFQCEHWDPAAIPPLSYDFAVANGRYLVNLFFAATFKSALDGPETVGSRVFDILAEGSVVYGSFDQVAATGGTTAGVAVVRSALVEVLDGNGLQIEFARIIENPAVKAIEVLAGPLACLSNSDCSDGNSCTTDTCVSGFCQNDSVSMNGLSCDDGLFCTATDTCQAGVCSGSGDPCSGGAQCANSCDEADDSCILPAGSACERDGDLCSVDQCDGAGACVFATVNACDDSNSCTTDICAASSCVNLPVADGISCDDGLFCTAADSCQSGTCVGTGDPCSAGSQCSDNCNENSDNCLSQVGSACDLDANLCTVEQCDGLGSCASVGTVVCQAPGQCEGGELCNPATGTCEALADPAAGTLCDDNAACTVSDICNGTGGCSGTDSCTGGLMCNLGNGLCEIPPGDPDKDGLFDQADPCPLDARNLCFGPAATDVISGNDIRINANAVLGAACQGTRVDCNGDTWLADFGWNQQSNGAECNLAGGCPISGITAIFGCSDTATEDIFQCEHWDSSLAPNLSYDFAVADGNYLVNLFFASTFESGTNGPENVGDRVFDILIEGTAAYTNFDQVMAAGGTGTAVVRSSVVSVSDGNGLQLEFLRVVGNPAIKAIEILFEGQPCADASACDDGIPCSADTCPDGFCRNDTSAMNGVVCDDGLFCTQSDFCQDGSCIGAGDPCASGAQCADSCNELSDTCIVQAGTACDLDGDLCTTDQCDGLGQCVFSSEILCQAASPCSGGETCNPATGTCQQQPDPAAGSACELDGDLCTVDQCDGAGTCLLATTVSCRAADQCDGGSVCNSSTGFCDDLVDATAGTLCDADTNACTIDACDGLGVCANVSAVSCPAATDCSGGGICDSATGQCQTQPDPAAGTSCTSDGNPCTDNQCDGAGSCVASDNISPCDDGQFCNGLDFCSAGQCSLHSGDPCTSGQSCDETGDICLATSCVSLTLADPLQCFTSRDCSVAVSMNAGTQLVSSLFAKLTSPLTLNCADTCTAGVAASNASCAADPTTCDTVLADIDIPVTAFADGEVATLSVQCTQPGTSQICLSSPSAGLVDGTPATVCGESCASFECSSCLSGDCNQSGQIDAGDPICSVLCLIGQAPPGADCSCAADCNCLGGTEAGDPICSVLRLIDAFTPDTCIAGPAAITTARADASLAEAALLLRGPLPRRSGRGQRAQLRLTGSRAHTVAAIHATFTSDANIGRVRLVRRLRKSGFSLALNRSGLGHAAVVITPPLASASVKAVGRGRLLRLRLTDDATTVSLSSSSLGSTHGLPLP